MILVIIIALIVLAIMLFPFRLRIRYQRSEERGHELVVMLRFRAGVRSGWEITVFRYSSHGQERAFPSQEERETDQHSSTTPLDIVLNGVTALQTLFDGGQDQKQGQSLSKTVLHRVDTPMRFLQYARDCEAWSWQTRFGTGDAASTAILYGIIWGVKATAYSVLSRWVHFRSTPSFLVVPDYNKATLAVVFDGIFRFRIGQIILMETFVILRRWIKGVGRFGVRQGTSY